MSDINNFYGGHNSKRNPYAALPLVAAKHLSTIIHLHVLLQNIYEQKSTLGNNNKTTYCMQVSLEPPDYF